MNNLSDESLDALLVLSSYSNKSVESVDIPDDLIDALIVTSIRTPSVLEVVENVELTPEELAGLEKIPKNLVDFVSCAVEDTLSKPLLSFSSTEQFDRVFNALSELDLVIAKQAPFLIQISRSLIGEELELMGGGEIIDFETDLSKFPKDVRAQIDAYLSIPLPESPLKGDGLSWDTPDFESPGFH